MKRDLTQQKVDRKRERRERKRQRKKREREEKERVWRWIHASVNLSNFFSIFSRMLMSVVVFSNFPSIKHKNRRWQDCIEFSPFGFIFCRISGDNFPQESDVIIILIFVFVLPVDAPIWISPKQNTCKFILKLKFKERKYTTERIWIDTCELL